MKKTKKIVLIVSGAVFILGGIVCFALGFIWSPLPGWPSYLLNIGLIAVGCFLISYFLIWRALHLEEKITWKKVTSGLVGLVFCFCLTGLYASRTDQTISEFIDSPSGRNSVVVFTEDYGMHKYYPAKWRLFYKWEIDQNLQSINYVWVYDEYEEATYSWIDDDTLEFVITKENGTSTTEYIRW